MAEFEQQCLNKPPVAAPSFHSPTISRVVTGGEGWSGQGEGAQHEDIQVCILALCSPLPALTIPPPLVDCAASQPPPLSTHPRPHPHLLPCDPCIPRRNGRLPPLCICHRRRLLQPPAMFQPPPTFQTLPRVPGPSPHIPASHGTCSPPSRCCPLALTCHPPLHAAPLLCATVAAAPSGASKDMSQASLR